MFASANRGAAGALANLLLQTRKHKPVICCFSAPLKIWDEEIKRLEASGIPNYPTPERAAKTLANLIRFNKLLRHPPYCSQEKSESGIERGNN
jgi:acyl-CoA synthetase (NDP forming)